jgi:ribosome biogenesis GTPase
MLLSGRVLGARSRSFTVETDDGTLTCRVLKGLRGRYPDLVDPVAVGDRVTVRRGNEGDATIEEVAPRVNKLSRPAVGREDLEQLIAANLSRAVVVQAVEPRWKTATWDRYLVMAAAGGVPPILALNKIDLDPESTRAPEFDVYRGLGIPVVPVSAKGRQGLDELATHLSGGMSVFIGPSGVGKSSLINALGSDRDLRTGELSRSTGKGRHTTTWTELLKLDHGVEVVDSPGLRVLGLWGIGADELAACFPEMAERAAGCRFRQCTHAHEPGCAIREAVAGGAIADFRYDSYLRIREALMAEVDRPRGGRARRR